VLRAAHHLHVQDGVHQHGLRLRQHHRGLHRRAVRRRRRSDPPAAQERSRRAMTSRLLPRTSATMGTRERLRRLHIARTFSTVLVIVIVAIQIYPLVWVLLASLKTPTEFAGGNPFALPA